MRVRDIMSEPVQSCTPETGIAQAARVMRAADCGILPVVDSDHRVMGVLTDRDICLAVGASNRSPRAIAAHEVMSPHAVVAMTDDDISTALLAMKTFRVRRVPVLDAKGHLAGLLSLEDIVLRGLQKGDVGLEALVDTLRALYERVPAPLELDGTAVMGG